VSQENIIVMIFLISFVYNMTSTRCWCCCLSGARCKWFACGPADHLLLH